jgi:putative transcriptional regulator
MAKKRVTGFGPRLQQLRLQAGLTQAQLAEKAGMHIHGLTKLEQGYREPAWTTVLDLAEALGMTCEAFTQSADDGQPDAAPRPRGRPKKAQDGDRGESASSGPKPGLTSKASSKGDRNGTYALNALQRIPENDPLRERGLQLVLDWARRNERKRTKDGLPVPGSFGRMQGMGVARACDAIKWLARIPDDDKLRKRGFQIVTEWIERNRKSQPHD